MENLDGDHRERVVRSPHCPNRIDRDGGSKVSGTCKGCAWGFFTPDGKGVGEDLSNLQLTPLDDNGQRAGYESDCGTVELSTDQHGRLGAERNGRFFPAIENNPATKRFMDQKPHLFEKASAP